MQYVLVPKELSIKEIISNDYAFAPSKYSGFRPKDRKRFLPLDEIVVPCNKKQKILRNEKYYYLEIGNIDVDSGYLTYTENYGYKLPTVNSLQLQKNDIIVSTVRTHRKGIGIIDKDFRNIVGTNAFLVIREAKEDLSKEYLLSLLRHDFFIEQIMALQNRGMYPRLDRNNLDKIYVPLPRGEKEHDYITVLQKAYIGKQCEIRRKHTLILNIIEKELLENQKPKPFSYEYPNFDEIKSKTRIDAGVYTKKFKEIEFIVKNYEGGYYLINPTKIRSGNTPTERFIGNKKEYKYCWITPTHFSDYGTLSYEERINCARNNLDKNSLLLVNRTSRGGKGEYVGIALYYDVQQFGGGQHNQGIYRIEGYEDEALQFMACFMNSKLMREYCAGLSVGSKMKEIKADQFLTIPFPNFPKSKQTAIAKLYHNPVATEKLSESTPETFLEKDEEWNKQAGVLELDRTAKKIKLKLEGIIHRLIIDEPIRRDFASL